MDRQHRPNRSRPVGWRRAAVASTMAALCAAGIAPAVARAGCVSAPVNVTFNDPVGDAPAGLVPDVSTLNVSLDGACSLTLGYGVASQTELLTDESVSWFIDTDGNASTGIRTAYVGADYAVVRTETAAVLVRYDVPSDTFVAATFVEAVGRFGVRFELSSIGGFGARVITIAGSSSWKASNGTTYRDWVPLPGVSPFAVTVNLTPFTPTPTPTPVSAPTPTPVASAPTPAPSAGSGTVQSGTSPSDDYACEVPPVRGLRLTQAKARLRSAGCTLGRVRHERSRRFPAGRVVRISASVDDLLLAEDRVQITVSSGPGPRASRAVPTMTQLLEATRTAAAQHR
jgi:hypothetical protein